MKDSETITTLTQERDALRLVLKSEIDARIRAESRALTADGLRVQLADARDRLDLCAAAVERLTQERDLAQERIVELLREAQWHRQEWQKMHDQMQEQRVRAEKAEAERDEARDCLGRTVDQRVEAEADRDAAKTRIAAALRCMAGRHYPAAIQALTIGTEGCVLPPETEPAKCVWAPTSSQRDDLDTLDDPPPKGTEKAGHVGWLLHAHDPTWQAKHQGPPAGCKGCAEYIEIPLTEMRRDVERLTRQRDEAKQAAQVALGSADRAAQALRAAQELAEVLRSQRDEAQALVQKVRDFADDEQKRAEFFQVEESKALDRVLTAEKERDEARAEVARLTQTQPVDDTPVRMTPAELLQRGGKWLGATREWLQWNRCHGNGESVQWGSEEEIRPPLKAREVEEIAAAAVATLWPVGAPPAVLDAARILTRWHYGADENHVRVLRAEWTALKAAVNSHPKVPDTAPLGATPDLPRAILLLASRPAPTHETIQRLCKWIGGIPFGETHRVLVDLCKAGRIVNRGLPDGYRLADEAAVHVAPLGTTPSGYDTPAPVAPEQMERIETAPSWERAREAWRAMRAAYGDLPKEKRQTALGAMVYDCDTFIGRAERGWHHAEKGTHAIIDALEKAARDASLWWRSVGVLTDFARSILALREATPRPDPIPADVPTGQEDQHDADMRANEATTKETP